MKESNLIVDKSFNFAVRIVKLYNYLRDKHSEHVLSQQILRSGTSIGANVREATRAQSKADFNTKMHIAMKEAAETEYWLELLERTGYYEAVARQKYSCRLCGTHQNFDCDYKNREAQFVTCGVFITHCALRISH